MKEKARYDEERGNYTKWEMYRLLEGEDLGPFHLPVTEALSLDAVRGMLARFSSVFLKPVDTWGGRSVGMLQEVEGRLIWRLQGAEAQEVELESVVAAYDGIDAIVQEAAPVVFFQGRPFDIRTHLQRDPDGGGWVYAGELVRVGGGVGVVSNVEISGGQVMTLEEMVREVFGEAGTESDSGGICAESLREELEDGSLAVCELLEHVPHFVEIGFDVCLDADGGLWLIEVNANDALGGPSHELFAKLPDQTLYEQMMERYHARQRGFLELLFGAMEMTVDGEFEEETDEEH
ncbi:YheC/YheD family protein [Tumebacillus flagellatus]|uniref:ATP-grasp domain-containing protein n=1 Tax=Tumebacillus flagellatus TaxID=1157490 RepID=A0A074M750_9BACL|nr:YheC/YheD family protein [Tumebacillus flagellatus]KEO81837.1 hypothetical protein EL26_18530 [Tumebacillus flagellatus]